ncbi:MAG TPA: methylated-DNA--[protein]-cysteine S-methyltransferase [Candidatus Tumulicola sp.]
MPTLVTPMEYVYATMSSPVGELKLIGSDRGLAAILWESDRPSRVRVRSKTEDAGHPVLIEARRQLEEYFAGKRKQFDLELDFVGTDFQKSVWNALVRIPFGETRSYGQIARELGNVNASRAVGAANGRNPISIVAPCHRVIGASGELTGFAGGIERKAHLLDLERGTLELNFDRAENAA